MSQYHSLIDKITSGRVKMVKHVLENSKTIDLTYDEGICFKLALKMHDAEMMKTLIGYFENKQLSEYEKDSRDYISLKNQVAEIIEEYTEYDTLDDEMSYIITTFNKNGTIDSEKLKPEEFVDIEEACRRWMDNNKPYFKDERGLRAELARRLRDIVGAEYFANLE